MEAGTQDQGEQQPEDDFGRLLESLIREVVRAMPRWRRDHTDARTTELVSRTWLKISTHPEYMSKPLPELLAILTTTVRNMLTDRYRHKLVVRKQGHPGPLDTDPPANAWNHPDIQHDVLAAIDDLASADPKVAAVFVMRVYYGAPEEDVATRLEISKRSVGRYLKLAKASLRRHLSQRGYDEEA